MRHVDTRATSTRRAATALAGITITMSLLAAACGDDGDQVSPSNGRPTTAAQSDSATAGRPTLEVSATDFAFQVIDPKVSAGPVDINLVNKGAENHHLTLSRVRDGAKAEDVVAALRKGDMSAMAALTPVGGPNGVAPGTSRKVTANLTAGSYVMTCHIPSPSDAVAHLDKGMVGSFTVAPAAATATAAAAPVTKGSIAITKAGYTVPAGVGPGTYQVVNEFDQPAEAALLRLRQGATAKDVLAFLGGQAPPGPPPFSVAGGVTSLAPKGSAFVDLDLTSGSYALISFSPNMAANGQPQFLTGLLTEVKVP